MLVLTRKPGESILIDQNIKVTITHVNGNQVRVGIEAPPEVTIVRSELLQQQLSGTINSGPFGKLRVLIIDDDAVDRATIRRYLASSRPERFSFSEAPLGEKGLERCRDDSPDFIVLDYCLPDIDGLEFLDALRNDKRGRRIPILFLSGYLSEQVGRQALDRGAQGVLAKTDLTPERLQSEMIEAVRHFSPN
jgi:carbon storage regulator CsrA